MISARSRRKSHSENRIDIIYCNLLRSLSSANVSWGAGFCPQTDVAYSQELDAINLLDLGIHVTLCDSISRFIASIFRENHERTTFYRN